MPVLPLPGGGVRGLRPNGPLRLNPAALGRLGVRRVYPLSAGTDTSELVTGYRGTATSVGTGSWSQLGGAAASYSGTSYTTLDAPSFLSGAGQFSVAIWAVTTTTASSGGGGGLRYLIGNEISGPDGQFVLRYSPSNARFEAYVFLLEGLSVGANGTTSVSANTLYHVALTWNAGTVLLYVNGRVENVPFATGTVANTTARAVTVGSDPGFDSRNRQWNGLLAHAVIADVCWTPGQVWSLYEPWSRWDLIAQPGRRIDVGVAAAAAAGAWLYGDSPLVGDSLLVGRSPLVTPL